MTIARILKNNLKTLGYFWSSDYRSLKRLNISVLRQPTSSINRNKQRLFVTCNNFQSTPLARRTTCSSSRVELFDKPETALLPIHLVSAGSNSNHVREKYLRSRKTSSVPLINASTERLPYFCIFWKTRHLTYALRQIFPCSTSRIP
jgi:hypothetical protein